MLIPDIYLYLDLGSNNSINCPLFVRLRKSDLFSVRQPYITSPKTIAFRGWRYIQLSAGLRSSRHNINMVRRKIASSGTVLSWQVRDGLLLYSQENRLRDCWKLNCPCWDGICLFSIFFVKSTEVAWIADLLMLERWIKSVLSILEQRRFRMAFYVKITPEENMCLKSWKHQIIT